MVVRLADFIEIEARVPGLWEDGQCATLEAVKCHQAGAGVVQRASFLLLVRSAFLGAREVV